MGSAARQSFIPPVFRAQRSNLGWTGPTAVRGLCHSQTEAPSKSRKASSMRLLTRGQRGVP